MVLKQPLLVFNNCQTFDRLTSVGKEWICKYFIGRVQHKKKILLIVFRRGFCCFGLGFGFRFIRNSLFALPACYLCIILSIIEAGQLAK